MTAENSNTIEVKNDFDFYLSTANSRFSKRWKNEKWQWSDFVQKCSESDFTRETAQEYMKYSKDQQDSVKDVGGFVGGYLTDGVRKTANVKFRSLITLDMDFGTPGIWEVIKSKYSGAIIAYSTHKHTPEQPRLRIIVPLSRPVKPEEYEPVARKFAEKFGMNLFDDSTYQTARLFYWPSTSKGAEFFFRFQDGEQIDVNAILSEYNDAMDASEWPTSSREGEIVKHEIKKQGDPLTKQGMIGLFCRTYYPIDNAIDKYLTEYYKAGAKGRYTYIKGSTSNGLACYDHKFAYANQNTDPTSKQLCNAFDLVRRHLFEEMDEGSTATGTRLPSYKAMMDLIQKDPEVTRTADKERRESTAKDFKDPEGLSDENFDWEKDLKRGKNLEVLPLINNAFLILNNHPAFVGHLKYDEFYDANLVNGDLPWDRNTPRWTDDDDANLRKWMESRYNITREDRVLIAARCVFQDNRYHPVKDYLNGLVWDGVPRLDRLIIEYLGAEDNELTRAMTRKHFTAATARILDPGCKYDYCLTLSGDEGIGKSTLFAVMGGDWFNDSITTIEGKAGMEQLRNSWIIELGELSALKRSDFEYAKRFITSRNDKYRPAYDKNVKDFPRQCVFCATTNERNFLRGANGNRRFWVIGIDQKLKTHENPRADLMANRDQLWAEAVHNFRAGEELYLTPDLEKQARERQSNFNERGDDPLKPLLEKYLNTLLPADWRDWEIWRRRDYFNSPDITQARGTVKRTRFIAAEFVREYLCKDPGDREYNARIKEVKGLMLDFTDWREIGTTRHAVCFYGVQRGFERVVKDEPKEDVL